jgi:MFS family permease
MSVPPYRTNYLLVGGTIVLAAGVFALDLALPLGVAVGMLYAVPVLVTLWFPRRRYTILGALTATLLILLGLFLSPPGGELWMALFNRAASLLIWSTAILVLVQKRANEHRRMLQGLLPICATCKKIRDADNQWHFLESYIEQHSEAHFTHGMCPGCAEKWTNELLTKRPMGEAG